MRSSVGGKRLTVLETACGQESSTTTAAMTRERRNPPHNTSDRTEAARPRPGSRSSGATRLAECADAGQLRCRDVVVFQEALQGLHHFVAGLENDGNRTLAGHFVEQAGLHERPR